jgi:HlyD family secretion protein
VLWRSVRTYLLFSLILLTVSCGRTDAAPTSTAAARTPPAATPSLPAATSSPLALVSGSAATYTVQRGQVAKTLEADGRVVPVGEVPVYFETPGYVGQMHVRQGDLVQKGDLLAELQANDLLDQIAQAELALDAAQRKLSAVEQSLQQEVALAELNLEAAQARLAQAQEANADAIADAELSLTLAEQELAQATALQAVQTAALNRARTLLVRAQERVTRAETAYQASLDRPSEPQENRDAYARELQEAQWGLGIAQADFGEASANQEAYQYILKGKEIAVEQAQAELARLQEAEYPLLALEVQRAQEELDWLKADGDPSLASVSYQTQLALVEQAQLTLKQLQEQLLKTQVVAPVDGAVVSLALVPNQPVEPFRTAIVIADPAAAEVSVGLAGEQLGDLAEGQQVAVVLSTDPESVRRAHIRCLPYPYGTCNSADDSTGSDQAVHVILEGDTSDVKLGTLAQITIVLDERDDVLWLPAAAIRSFQGSSFVFVEENGRQRRVDIDHGLEGQGRVEILSGLQQGQMVVAP